MMKRRAKLLGQTEAAATPTKKARMEMPPPPAPPVVPVKPEETKQVTQPVAASGASATASAANTQAIVSVLEALPSSSYLQQQEEHLKAVERERKLQKSREQKLRSEATAIEPEGPTTLTGDQEGAAPNDKGEQETVRVTQPSAEGPSNAAVPHHEMQPTVSQHQFSAANNHQYGTSTSRAQQKAKNKRAIFLNKALDLPFYKGIQLPTHLKWITVTSRATESQLMQEIHALDLEVEQLEKKLLQQKIIAQVQHGFQQQALAEGIQLNITTSIKGNQEAGGVAGAQDDNSAEEDGAMVAKEGKSGDNNDDDKGDDKDEDQ